MTTSRRRIALTATALTLAVSLTACSDAGAPAAEPGTTTSPSSSAEATDGETSEHNEADTQFAQMMIVHHEGALEMAELAVDQASTEEVRALGERIAAAQGPEIELMSEWLESWGENVAADAGHGGMDHGGMDMNGMDQEQAMASLSTLQGTEFDREFLELMVAHHRGAIEMAEAQLADGQNPQARELAQKIIDDQAGEITEMEDLLRGL